MNSKYFKCACYSEGIEVTAISDEKTITMFSFSYSSRPFRFSFFYRLRQCCYYLFKREKLSYHEVILYKDDALELAKFINEI